MQKAIKIKNITLFILDLFFVKSFDKDNQILIIFKILIYFGKKAKTCHYGRFILIKMP